MTIAVVSLGIVTSAHTAAPPDVPVILTDDRGWADIGHNNPGKVHTPNLDPLAGESAVFKNHYVMRQCAPTRVALFTGRYAGRFGRAPLQATNEQCVPPGTLTLATMLKSAGYETHLSGKWHMGEVANDGPIYHLSFSATASCHHATSTGFGIRKPKHCRVPGRRVVARGGRVARKRQ